MIRKSIQAVALSIALLIIFSTQVALAAGAKMSEDLRFDCSPGTTEDSKFFRDIQDEARKINQAYCDQLSSKVPSDEIELNEIALRLPAFGELVHRTVQEKLTKPGLSNMRAQVEYFRNILIAEAGDPRNLPSMQAPDNSTLSKVNISFFFGDNQTDVQQINKDNNGLCESLDDAKPNCKAYLKDLKDAINPYQQNANAFNVYKTRVQLSGLSKSWDRYFETARYQNTAGIALTTIFEKDHFAQKHLVGPPDTQWFALQPSLVLENVEEAADGENIEYAVSIEWIGFNWWKDSFLGVPFGISAASVLADRPGVKDVGHGLMFHFDNQYTVGITDHAGDEGIFITVDVLKLFQDKKEQLGKYKEKVKSKFALEPEQ